MKRSLPAFLLLVVPVIARPALAATSCYTQSCNSCSPGGGAGHVSTIIRRADFPAVPDSNTPIAFVDPNDGRGRRFVLTQEGRIWVWNGSAILPQPFLDLTSRVVFGGERGLLAMAVAPDYASSGSFYLYYTGRPPAVPNNGDIAIERFSRSAADPDRASPTPTRILTLKHDLQGNHNGGWLAFGPDGDLYVSIGDGGGACDYGGNGQNKGVLFGKVLRLDVRPASGGLPPDCGGGSAAYRIPADNPLVGAAGCDEIWAYGFRNPFRFSFDHDNGDLFVGDVGQSNWEEINFQRRPVGEPTLMDFGWVCREGCASSSVPPSSCSPSPTCGTQTAACQYPTAKGFFDPILCHSNSSPPQGGWNAIMGGYRYRGSQVPELAGRYLYGDAYCGQVWRTTSFDRDQPQAAQAQCWLGGQRGLFAFSEDHLGELYLVNGGAGTVQCIHDGGGCPWAAAGGSPSVCVEGAGTLCLRDGRYQVSATWRTASGASGEAHVVRLTNESGYLWFFADTNVEAIVKVLDGCALNNRFWVFAAGLTDVRVEIRVVDTTTGIEKTYVNQQGKAFAPIQDTSAFATCP
jgi:hypothetical protein